MVTRVSVSQVVACDRCPRRFALERGMERAESPRYTVCREISSRLGGPLDAGEVWEGVLVVRPGIDPAFRQEADAWVERCRAAAWPVPEETDVRVTSDTLGLMGVVDKVFDGEPWFAVTRASEPPAAGVRGSDRVRVACYAACIRETLDMDPPGGLVEYIPGGTARPCILQPGDRRRMLRALRAARKVLEGAIPPRPAGAPCERCPHVERCTAGPRRLSDLL